MCSPRPMFRQVSGVMSQSEAGLSSRSTPGSKVSSRCSSLSPTGEREVLGEGPVVPSGSRSPRRPMSRSRSASRPCPAGGTSSPDAAAGPAERRSPRRTVASRSPPIRDRSSGRHTSHRRTRRSSRSRRACDPSGPGRQSGGDYPVGSVDHRPTAFREVYRATPRDRAASASQSPGFGRFAPSAESHERGRIDVDRDRLAEGQRAGEDARGAGGREAPREPPRIVRQHFQLHSISARDPREGAGHRPGSRPRPEPRSVPVGPGVPRRPLGRGLPRIADEDGPASALWQVNAIDRRVRSAKASKSCSRPVGWPRPAERSG